MESSIGFLRQDLADSPCSNCVAACCRSGVIIPLRKREARQMITAGGQIEKVPKADIVPGHEPPFGMKLYRLLADCVNLDPETGVCTTYNTRPSACRQFVPENDKCAAMRAEYEADIATQGSVDLEMPTIRPVESGPAA